MTGKSSPKAQPAAPTISRRIADELGVGIATVTRGAKISSAEIFARILNNS